MRFRATTPNSRGIRPGIFALVNGLYNDGLLSPDEVAFRRRMNDWYEANLPNPGVIAPSVYDRQLHPTAVAWFKTSAHQYLAPIPSYLRILEAHATPCEMATTAHPGVILYEDPYQVIAESCPTLGS